MSSEDPANLLPPLVATADAPLRLTPTDVSQFVRLEQCERYLRFRVAERAGQKFMEAYDVNPQRITPLLTLSGHAFEAGVAAGLSAGTRAVDYAARQAAHDRPDNNQAVVAEAKALAPGQSVLLFQARLRAVLHGWHLRGDVDLMKLTRSAGGTLEVLIADMKASASAKVEHRLQVAFYRLMLEAILANASLAHAPVRTGIVFRPPAGPSPEEAAEVAPLLEAAKAVLGLDDVLLEVVADPDAYARSAHDLVLSADSVARRVAARPFDQVPYCLTYKCDGCLYNEFCMKWSAEREDLSLLPYFSGTEKQALRRSGITTVGELAAVKDFVPADGSGRPPTELVAAPGREALVKQLAATWPVGPRLDELVHRARSFRRSVRRDGTQALSYIPGKGNSTLPVSTAEVNPNLVRVYVDAQHDYLEGRVYLLGALVAACDGGTPAARRSVVHLTDGPPDTAAKERELFVAWTKDLLNAVVELAVGGPAPAGGPPSAKKSAPIHVVFFNRYEQRLMLDGLARNFQPMLKATPPLYDFLTQLAAFDSPIASFLDEEVRTFKNFPMTCQSLQSLAAFLKFDWNAPHPFRQLFKARLFDYLGKIGTGPDGSGGEWYTRRSRFSSSVPLEYAYAAWGQLPPPPKGRADEFADFRPVTPELLQAFAARRLEAIEHVAAGLHGNPNTAKTSFVLPDLAGYTDKADDLAHALAEFVIIERLVSLGEWKSSRHAPPERRVLSGEALVVEYREADQEPAAAAQNRDNERRRLLREKYLDEQRAANPGKPPKLTKPQQAECKWSPAGLKLRLRLSCEGIDCDLHEALLMSNLRRGDRLVLAPRWVYDERLAEADRRPFTPTPKQMLYGQRAELLRVVAAKKDAAGRVTEAFAEVELVESRGGEYSRPYVFPSFDRPLIDGQLYTLDPCPNEWYAYWCAKVVEGLCDGEPNALYARLQSPPPPGDGAGSPGQKKFLAGLDAFQEAGLLHDFEPGKRQFIGSHAATPVLLVQGPPGTGKSYSTAFAVFARLQGAIVQGRDCRAFLTCKTHAATDVLVENVLAVRRKLAGLREKDRALFDRHFDPRLLEVPIYRVAPREPPPEGVVALAKDAEHGDGEADNADVIQEAPWAVVAATPGGTYGMLKAAYGKEMFGHFLCDLLVLDEASQMSLPDAVMAALPLKADAPLVVVGDHRQMPPIVKHDWDNEARRTFRQYQVYQSLYDTLLGQDTPPVIRFAESFRLHAAMAEFLRQEVYRHDGIAYHSRRTEGLAGRPLADALVAAVLHPDYPLVVVVHDEEASQLRNPFEQALISPVLAALADAAGGYGLDAVEGLGVVVPHRAQRAALQQALPQLCILDPATGLPARSAVDTVERFQGGERSVIVVSATESDRAYLLASAGFLLDPRRLTVALSRAKRKIVLVAARSIFELFSPDEQTFANAQMWKNLLRACPTRLLEGEREGKRVSVWGGG